jgi:cytochrome c oxidase accessory protein FixG
MGIDIRDGAQLECINCGLCIDACDDVMERIGQPQRLIAYDTDANVRRRLRGVPARFRFVRPRTVLYAGIMALVGTVMVFGLSTRRSVDLDVLRDRNPDFVTLSDGAVRNAYTLKLMNRADTAREFDLSLTGVRPRTVNVIGLGDVQLPARVAVGPDKVRTLRMLVTVGARDVTAGSTAIEIVVRTVTDREARSVPAVFVAGARR